MKICVLFGGEQAPCSILPQLQQAVSALIEQQGVRLFYYRRRGDFGEAAALVLQWAKLQYPQIESYAVSNVADKSATLRIIPYKNGPESLTNWLLKQAHYVIVYASDADKALATATGKTVIELPSR